MYNKRILLVEDNPSDIELTTRALKKNRLSDNLVVKEDGEAALRYLFDECGQLENDDYPSLILLDLKLPIVDGMEVLRQVKADDRTKRIPIVVLTTSSEEEDIDKSYDLGANAYIRKPVDNDRFIVMINYLGLFWLIANEPSYRY
ncbi:MAG: response regulator [Candidatus Cloacimonas sp.]|jgi:two-component system response regulator|nr:response regulator [Candidatus Cloacimonas sp.]